MRYAHAKRAVRCTTGGPLTRPQLAAYPVDILPSPLRRLQQCAAVAAAACLGVRQASHELRKLLQPQRPRAVEVRAVEQRLGIGPLRVCEGAGSVGEGHGELGMGLGGVGVGHGAGVGAWMRCTAGWHGCGAWVFGMVSWA